MRIPLDRDSAVPLYEQIEQFLREQIQTEALAPETRLPASRDLAASLGVSRITVANAYAELEAAGLVHSRQGSGTYVSPPPLALPGSRDETAGGDWPLWQQELLNRAGPLAQQELDHLMVSTAHPDLISFAGGVGDGRLFSVDDFRKALQTVIRRDGAEAMGYGDRAGYAPLRATIAHILTSQGIPTHPDHVLITSGSQQAMTLVARLLLQPGDVALVESPTYMGILDILRPMGVRLLGVPVDDQGMQVERVEEAVCTARPRLIYTTPTFHNPTGTSMSGVRRRQLVTLASRYSIPILEDDYVGDLRYDGHAQPAIKALDPGGHVIYISTFSKMLMPGLRVGFLVASGPVYEQLLARKRAEDLATSNLMQRALEAYITVGRYQAHLRRACQAYRRRRDTMLTALTHTMPPGTRWLTPQGGLFIWLQLPEGLSANELYPVAGKEGVIYAPGSVFYPCARVQSYLRLNFAMHPPSVIEEGVRRLGRAIDLYLALKKSGERAPEQRTGVSV
jgi:GntR family transcriptional regulator / MocR family aminotransferase